MNRTTGDLLQLALDKHFDVIVHGCNCHCQMGAGIAKAIAERFPEALAADRETVPGDRGKLGRISFATVRRAKAEFIVVNGYTQFDWDGPGVLVDYEAVAAVMRTVKSEFGGRRIGYPKIGAGLAGGDWTRISAIIDDALAGENHTLVEFAP